MFKLSRQGVHFSRHGDSFLLRWPWVSGLRFNSSLYAYDFNNFRDYWRVVGKLEKALITSGHNERVSGMRMEEVLSVLAAHCYPKGCVAVLFDVDPSKKDSRFWNRLPKKRAEQLLKDVVVFNCQDRAEALGIVQGTPSAFASALAFHEGMLIDSNLWGD